MTVLPEFPVEAVRRYYRLVDAGDVDGVVASFTEDTVYRRPGYEPIVGHRELREFYRGTRVIERGEHRISSVVAHDDLVAVNGDFTGTLKDGTAVELRFADFFTISADGRFSTRETFFFAPMV
ncbi:nuclear transport factor 2 family protein [Amycolatopsis sp. 195334CR]|uniref:nuclear transport factor 2 family protein n=1 Tax=Amycolatopsis sp. 195334CR TaxID=2814588 RepID=UPI001A8CBE9A|nr:nuclear transport factor 2 family protein [Amycolatopsis sp. 195334CR]MBN6039797.1 nuclear transport factor 2 family protein [Amycolatopsis sp. 195334CR]